MKLKKIEVTFEYYVLCKDECSGESSKIFREALKDLDYSQVDLYSSIEEYLKDVADDWKDSIPYMDDEGMDFKSFEESRKVVDRTIRELFENGVIKEEIKTENSIPYGYEAYGSGAIKKIYVKEEAIKLAASHKETGSVDKILWFPSEDEVRLIVVEEDTVVALSGNVEPFYFHPSPIDKVFLFSATAVIRPDEVGKLNLPEGWGTWNDGEEI